MNEGKTSPLARALGALHVLWAMAVFIVPLLGVHAGAAGYLYMACLGMAYLSFMLMAGWSGTLAWFNALLFPFAAFWLGFLLWFDCAPNSGVIDNLVKTSLAEMLAWSKHQIPLFAATILFWGLLLFGALRPRWQPRPLHRKFWYAMAALGLCGFAGSWLINDLSRMHPQQSLIPFINNSSLTEITWINESGWPMGWITMFSPHNHSGPMQLTQVAAMAAERPVLLPLINDQAAENLTVVFVIGESQRADWLSPANQGQLLPGLHERWKKGKLRELPHMWSNSNLTMYAVPAMLTGVAPADMMEGITEKPSGLGYLRQAGFFTAFVTNQSTPLFAENGWDYFKSPGSSEWHDQYLEVELQRLLITGHPKKALTLQMMGAHFYYEDRYPAQFAEQHRPLAKRLLARNPAARLSPAQQTVFQEYLVSIAYSGSVLEHMLQQLDHLGTPAVLIFCSDHGENLFDDKRMYYWHSVNGNPALPEFRPAAFLAWNDSYARQFPARLKQLESIADQVMQQQQILPLWMRMAGFHLQENEQNDPFSSAWQVPPEAHRSFYINRKVVKADTLAYPR